MLGEDGVAVESTDPVQRDGKKLGSVIRKDSVS